MQMKSSPSFGQDAVLPIMKKQGLFGHRFLRMKWKKDEHRS